MGRHEAGWVPDTTAAGYHGRHRREPAPLGYTFLGDVIDWSRPAADRCWDCGHPFDAACGCVCCYDSHEGGPDDV